LEKKNNWKSFILGIQEESLQIQRQATDQSKFRGSCHEIIFPRDPVEWNFTPASQLLRPPEFRFSSSPFPLPIAIAVAIARPTLSFVFPSLLPIQSFLLFLVQQRL
jgi:hypothetical protein